MRRAVFTIAGVLSYLIAGIGQCWGKRHRVRAVGVLEQYTLRRASN